MYELYTPRVRVRVPVLSPAVPVASGSAAHGDGVFECRFFRCRSLAPPTATADAPPSDLATRARRPPPDEQVAAGKLDDTDSTLITIIHACHG